MKETILVVRCPVTTMRLNQVEAPIYKLGGELYLKSSDLGRVLGFAQPASAVSHLRSYHRAEIEPHVCQAWLGIQRGPQNIAKLISLQGCAILAAKVTKPEAQAAQAAFAALQGSTTNTKQEEKTVSQEETKEQAAQAATQPGDDDAEKRVGEGEPEISEALPEQFATAGAVVVSQDLPVVEGPAKVVEFQGQEVPVYEVGGELYLTGEDIGTMLGLSDPRDSVNTIFNRHKQELDGHSTTIKLMARDGKARAVRLYSQEGCYLISMFARTDTAKAVRQWLAALPGKVRQAIKAQPEAIAEMCKATIEDIAYRILNLLSMPAGLKLGLDGMRRLTRLRAAGSLTQREASRLFEISVDAVRTIEKEMAPIMGLEIKPFNRYEENRRVNRDLARLVAKRFAMDLQAQAASLEAPRNRKKMH